MGASTLKVADSIESSGYPLAFKVAQGVRTPLLGMAAAKDVMKVEVRAMGGHQKECVVTDGAGGSAWRLVSDEGAALTGTDLAPFPLGFMSAGYQADLQGRIMRLAAERGVAIRSLRTEIINQYGFAGSFFRGTGRGSALAPVYRVLIESPAKADDIRALVKAAADSSPLIASVRTALTTRSRCTSTASAARRSRYRPRPTPTRLTRSRPGRACRNPWPMPMRSTASSPKLKSHLPIPARSARR